MIFDIQYNAERNYIHVTFAGAITMPVVREYIDELLPVLEETDCRRLLSDCRQADIHLTSADIMQFPKIAAASPLTARLRRAVLALPDTSGYALYETLSKVTGQHVRVFKEQDEAMEWLMEDAD